MRSIYLAGKITKNDWRHAVTNAAYRAACGSQDSGMREDEGAPGWFEHDVTVLDAWRLAGPFFSGCDHGCAHGTSTHALLSCVWGMGEEGALSHVWPEREWVFRQCREAIERSDLFFVWCDDPSAYGTLVEVGYARALKKEIVLASPPGMDPSRDLWFAVHAAGGYWTVADPVTALRELAKREQRVQDALAIEGLVRS